MMTEEEPKTEEVKPEIDWSAVLKENKETLADMKKYTEEYKTLVSKNQEAAAITQLGGKSDAAAEPQAKEETPEEYAKRVMTGN